MLLRTALSVLSPAGARGRLSVVIFHRVLPAPDPLFPDEVDVGRFDAICGWLASWFRVMPLDDAVRRLREGTLPARALCITFDDGYADNADVALPVLQRHGLTATFFIATGFLDGGCMWNDRVIEAVRGTRAAFIDPRASGIALDALPLHSVEERRRAIDNLLRALKYLHHDERSRAVDDLARALGVSTSRDLMMTSGQVRRLHDAGMQIGAHTVTHPILAGLEGAQARREIDESRRFLEDLLDARINVFAYPNGRPGTDYTPESVDLVRELGFDVAVSTAWGAADRRSDPFQIPRFTPWDRSRTRFGARMLTNLAQSARTH